MTELKYSPVHHDHEEFLAKAKQRPGFTEAYESLELEYALSNQMLKARAKAGLTQDAVAERMGTTKSAISRLEAAGRHAPSLATLKRYAVAVGCELQVKLVPKKTHVTLKRHRKEASPDNAQTALGVKESRLRHERARKPI